MKTMAKKHDVDETNTSIIKTNIQTFNPPPFCKSTFTILNLIAFLDVRTREKQCLSLMYTMYGNASNNTPSYTHVSSYVYEESTPSAWKCFGILHVQEWIMFGDCPNFAR